MTNASRGHGSASGHTQEPEKKRKNQLWSQKEENLNRLNGRTNDRECCAQPSVRSWKKKKVVGMERKMHKNSAKVSEYNHKSTT